MFSEVISRSPRILAECAVAERLRRHPEVELHPSLFNTPLIYGPEAARSVMTGIYQEYMDAAAEASLPILLTAPTWRLNPERVAAGNVPETINSDAVDYLIGVAKAHTSTSTVLVGALVGPRGDCYRPEEAPRRLEAERFHRPQIEELAETPAEFLLAQTLPSVEEALGIAQAMGSTGKPYLISFCTGPDGHVLDGTPLPEAMEQIDQTVDHPPVGFFVNCTHPRFLTVNYPAGSLERLIGIQANGSSKDVTQLDASSKTEADPISDWAASMHELQARHQVKILGGCCGTGLQHLKSLAAPGPMTMPGKASLPGKSVEGEPKP